MRDDQRFCEARFVPLTKDAIEDHIQRVVHEVNATGVAGVGEDEQSLRPRWIEAAELVRRMRRFIVYN